MTFFDCTADLVGQLNGNGQHRKECHRLTHPLSKISGYANAANHYATPPSIFSRSSSCTRSLSTCAGYSQVTLRKASADGGVPSPLVG